MLNRFAKKIFGDRNTERLIEAFFRDLPTYESSLSRVLVYVGISAMYLTPVEILIYHLLRKNGFDVDYLVYDESVPINEVITREREESQGKEKFWGKSCRNGRRMLEAGHVDYQIIPIDQRAKSISQLIPSLEEILQYQMDGIDFGDIVAGTLFRYYKSLTFGENADQVARRMLTTALSNYFCVKHRCEENDYRYVLFSHGIYVTWQPVVEYCRHHGLNYICYDRGKTKDQGTVNANQPSPDWSFDSAWDRYRDKHLNEQQKKQVATYLAERELQTGDVYAYNFSARAEDLKKEKQRLGIPQGRKCVTFFANLIWDAANSSRDIAFPSALDCIIQTIDHFRRRDDVQVVVRSHPAEKVHGTKERYSTLVRDHFSDQLPSNVTLISPEDDVNSFTVIDMTDVGVVNTSTVGLEMAMLGKPVLLISETHYRGKGFTSDVKSPEAYFASLEDALNRPAFTSQQQELAEKYFYMMMFLYQHQLPTRYENGVFRGFSCKHFNELHENEPLVQIVNSLVNGLPSDFVHWPEPEIGSSLQ